MEEDESPKGLRIPKLHDSLVKECRIMTEYCLANGKTLDANHILVLEKEDEDIPAHELLSVYNYLLTLVKPATPGTLVLFEKNRQSDSAFKFLGPLPIVRRFMLVTIVSLLALIGISLSPHVNATSIELSMLQGEGWDQVQRLAFLLAAASVGGSFYALFKMNSYIKKGTFDMKYAATYWSSYVLGLVSGILLSELFIVFISSGDATEVSDHIANERGLDEDKLLNTARFLLKPILAILGGFSANLVYRVINRLIEAVESVFKGSAEDEIARAEEAIVAQSLEMETNIRTNTAQRLLTLKNDLVNANVPTETLSKVDATISSLVSVPLASIDTATEVVVPEVAEPVTEIVEDEEVDVDIEPEEDDEPRNEPPPSTW